MKRAAFQEEISVDPGAPIVVSADFVRLHLRPSGHATRLVVSAEHEAIRARLHIERSGHGVRIVLGSASHELPWPLRDVFAPTRANDLWLYVPDAALLDITASAGRIHAEHLTGDLSIRSDAGRVDVHSFQGRLRVAASAGRIEGTEISGKVDISSNAGAVRLEIVNLDAGEHRVQTNLGSARVDLARGLPVRLEATTTMGSSQVNFPSSPDASAILRLSADLGSVHVNESARVWAQGVRPFVAAQAAREEQPSVAPARLSGTAEQHLDLVDRERALAWGVSHEDWVRLQRQVAAGSVSKDVARELVRALRR